MNFLRRAIARELLFSSRSSSTKCLLLLLQEQHHQQRHSISILQNRSSPYSTGTTKLKNAAKNPNPQQQPPLSSSSTREETVQTQAQAQEREIEIELGLKNEESKADWLRPSEIPWQTKVANSVNLIGYVQIPVQFEVSSDGKYWAGTIISQRNDDSSDSPPFWIPVIFEGDLAHIAACHLKAKDCIYIAGQLSADPPPFTMSEGQANVQVMVRSINFVQGSCQMKKTFTPCNLELDKSGAGFEASLANKKQTSGVGSLNDEVSVNQLWNDLFTKPHEWWDIRLKKRNSVAAAFENKLNGQLLWINESTPDWIQKKVECLTFDRKIVQENLESVSEMKNDSDRLLDSWRDLLRNPQKWWDHRGNKLSGLLKEKHPDFKHKDSGLALWLNCAPRWVMSELQGLQFDVQLPKVNRAKESKGDDSWKNLVEHPEKWWDNRGDKINVRGPDFKHKDTGEVLWLSDSPSWVSSRLPPLKAKHTAAIDKRNKPLSETM